MEVNIHIHGREGLISLLSNEFVAPDENKYCADPMASLC